MKAGRDVDDTPAQELAEASTTKQFPNAIKAPHRYAVEGSDTTVMPIAASLPGQK
ncbi:MAG: hypothetical protein H7211_06890 [Aquabacterium sp.]|nr:hypothetical protein [Ferruginibacter sp.]